jgi:uncharacterized protein (DUF58 family)
VRIRPTELGWKGLLLLASLELAFLATSYSNLFFLLIAFCAVLGGLGVVWALQNLRPVRIERIEVGPGPAGQPRPLQVTLGTGGRRCFDLAVRLRCGRERFEVAHAALLRGTLQLDGALPARARGIETVRVQLRSTFPFGLFAASRDTGLTLEIVTHPNPELTAATASALGTAAGAVQGDDGFRSSTVAGLRPFRTGDSLAAVHWKASARRGTAVVKEREREADLATDVVLDRRGAVASFEPALAIAAGHVLATVGSERTLRLLSQDTRFVLGPDRSRIAPVLRWLALAQPLPDDAPPPPSAPGAIRLGGPRPGARP